MRINDWYSLRLSMLLLLLLIMSVLVRLMMMIESRWRGGIASIVIQHLIRVINRVRRHNHSSHRGRILILRGRILIRYVIKLPLHAPVIIGSIITTSHALHLRLS